MMKNEELLRDFETLKTVKPFLYTIYRADGKARETVRETIKFISFLDFHV